MRRNRFVEKAIPENGAEKSTASRSEWGLGDFYSLDATSQVEQCPVFDFLRSIYEQWKDVTVSDIEINDFSEKNDKKEVIGVIAEHSAHTHHTHTHSFLKV